MRSGLLMCVSMFAMMSMLAGCAQPMTRVDFQVRAGTTMTFQGKTFDLPAVVPLPRPRRIGDVAHSTVSFTFPGPGPDQQPISASGVLDVIGYNETDVDLLADKPLPITDAEIAKLLDGDAIVINGKSPSNQPIYHLIIGKPK